MYITGGIELGATIEKSLYIGILKTRFDAYDDVKLKLKDGTEVYGTITEFIEERSVTLDTKEGYKDINVDDIEDYIN